MSNDPNQPEPGERMTPTKTPKSSGEVTEADLWDLDRIIPQNISAVGKFEALPPRHTSSTNVRPTRPSEAGGAKPYASTVKKPVVSDSGTERKGEPEAKASGESGYQPKPAGTPAGTPTGDDGRPSAETDGGTATRATDGSLTKTEKIALSTLCVALILAATLAVIHFTNRVPLRSAISEETKFPISGKLIEVKSAVTYWRKPITSGDHADVVRRGTALIPVVRLALQSKPCAIRVFFRDEEGIVIGDGISRDVDGDQELVIPATAGFDDIGMHAAYRTGEKPPWIVQVYEGPSRSADHKGFRKVLETQISSDRR